MSEYNILGSSSFSMDKMFFNSRPPLVFMRISTQNKEEPHFVKENHDKNLKISEILYAYSLEKLAK